MRESLFLFSECEEGPLLRKSRTREKRRYDSGERQAFLPGFKKERLRCGEDVFLSSGVVVAFYVPS